MLEMKSRKRHLTKGVELQNQEKKSECVKKSKPTNTKEYWKLTPSKKWKLKKNLKESISEEPKDYSRQNIGTISKG